MALIVESGTGLASAESYCSVAFATQYHADRGNAAWAALASDTLREQYLRRATEYMVAVYRQLWKGYRAYQVQALDWPRAYCPIPDVVGGTGSFSVYVPMNEVPVVVQRACAELALRAITADLLGDLEQATIREKVGPLEVEYDPNSPQRKRYPQVDRLLKPFLHSLPSEDGAVALGRA